MLNGSARSPVPPGAQSSRVFFPISLRSEFSSPASRTGSPYLWELIRIEPGRFLTLLESDPDTRFEAILAETARAVASTRDEAQVMRLLRRMKSEAALLIALADLGGVWPVMHVTKALTAVADTAVRAAVRHLLAEAAQRGRFRSPNPEQPEEGSGYIVLAMGKMGARELNYSSDIDLIVFYDAASPALPPDTEPGPFFVRLTRSLVKLLQERTADGYVFRTDLRLRPDPGSTGIAVSTAAALDYYESVGQNWERAALIKARPCAGDIAAGRQLLRDLAPFIWRKHLDYAAVADIHAMKRQIHAYRGHGEIAVEGHNVKLGRGGIREIEFFVQTQQLIAGGRHPELRPHETLAALSALVQGGWIGADARDEMHAAYCFLRLIENRLQMVADEQTHSLPADREGLESFARFAGFPDRDAFAQVLMDHLRNVQKHYAALFERAPSFEAERQALSFSPRCRRSRDARQALDHGLSPAARSVRARAPLAHAHLIARSRARSRARNSPNLFRSSFPNLPGPPIPMRRSMHSTASWRRCRAAAICFAAAPEPGSHRVDRARAWDRAAACRRRRALSGSDGCAGRSEFLRRASRRYGACGRAWPLAAAGGSYEDFLDRIRIFAQEQMFLIGTRILSGTVSAEQAGEVYARLADVLIRSLHRAVEDNFAERHGRLPQQETAILALGKLGGREMTATSDLDLIVVYDFDGAHPESDGPRPLYGAQYFARLTQRLIGALTAQTNYGVLYQVDMRLRPSGRAGPARHPDRRLCEYQENEAWTWEHMALTRARVVSASRPHLPPVSRRSFATFCAGRATR